MNFLIIALSETKLQNYWFLLPVQSNQLFCSYKELEEVLGTNEGYTSFSKKEVNKYRGQ